ncbi:hypothetical protein JNW88_27950 [Micromonospora sp. ATA32]|nr:hypothetical protein [Micromonospora sp. ATA32]
MGLGRALAVTGHLDEARRCRAEAITTAERLDDPGLTASVLAAFEVPAVWTRNDDEHLSRRIVQAADRTLAVLGDDEPEQRSRLLSILALELRGSSTDRGHRAAAEAEAIARKTGNAALLAFALNARFMHTFPRAGPAESRARIGADLVDLAARHNLVTFEVLGHLILLQAHCALADLTAADADARAADRLADRYDLPLVGVFTQWYAGLRLAVGGQPAEAEAAYRAADARLRGSGMPGLEQGLLPLRPAVACAWQSRGRTAGSSMVTGTGGRARNGAPTSPGSGRWSCWRPAAATRRPRRCVLCRTHPTTCCARPGSASPPARGRARRPPRDAAGVRRTPARRQGAGRGGKWRAHARSGGPAPRRPRHRPWGRHDEATAHQADRARGPGAGRRPSLTGRGAVGQTDGRSGTSATMARPEVPAPRSSAAAGCGLTTVTVPAAVRPAGGRRR